MLDFVEIDTNGIDRPKVGNDLHENRTMLVQMDHSIPDVTISVQGWNRIEKTKRCIESILKYTQGIDYELLLIDSGSEDGTLEYFQSIPYEKKRIVRVSKNLGSGYPSLYFSASSYGKYIAAIANDIIVTENWLSNILACMESDSRIGMVCPVSSNVSNLQQVAFTYSSYDEMQQIAKQFNHSDPKKWEDRLRLMNPAAVYRKELLLCLGQPIGDFGYFHDFGDDDLSFSIRRAGYRTVLAGDTWVCHDHDYSHGEGKDPVEFRASLEIGRQNFRDKYFGVDAWDDVNNYLLPILSRFPEPQKLKSAKVLGVDVRCGTPILDIKNWLRRAGTFDTELSAFTQDAKYWVDLKTICSGNVICDREEFLCDSFLPDYFDYVVIDRPINRYHEPQKIIDTAFTLCKKNGYVICSLKNTASFQEYVNLLGERHVYDREFSYNIPLEALNGALERKGTVKIVFPYSFNVDADHRTALSELLVRDIDTKKREELLNRMLCEKFLFLVQK